MTKWEIGSIYKFLNDDEKTIVFIEILDYAHPMQKDLYRSNKYFINNKDSEYFIQFNKIYTGIYIEAEKTTRRDVFIQLFKGK